ncbi:uncharacterized protein LOC135377682 isoform X1 [Ornithodoros turicata]|uniref:uncharacterized protein LOC135377682 isoform X1 n=2 Tax=Ornithodoros turicata TaxID=34597 RepID=UPI0031399F53
MSGAHHPECVEVDCSCVGSGMTRVGNQTNSTDPAAVNSRIFVGNLNTHVISKEDVERLFKRYGRIIGISMHKGYAFVQYTDTYDARNAVLGEDGRTIAGQILDVNMVSEPKPHQVNRKRQNFAADPFATPRQLGSPVKRARTELVSYRAGGSNKGVIKKKLQTYADPDILICGNCREVFPGLQKLLEHKRHRCRLRFTCRCQVNGMLPLENSVDMPSPVCAQCLTRCGSWWELVCHVEGAHGISVYHHSLETSPGSEDHEPKSVQTDDQAESLNNDGTCEEEASVASDSHIDDWATLVAECVENNSDEGVSSVPDSNDEDGDKITKDVRPGIVAHDTVEKGVDTADLQIAIVVGQS